MITVPLAQAKNQLSELIERVLLGEAVVVTRRGKVVATINAANAESAGSQRGKVQETFRQLERLAADIKLEGDIKAIARNHNE